MFVSIQNKNFFRIKNKGDRKMSNDLHVNPKKVAKIGTFTKNAVQNFENNIVNQTNYLEKVKRDEERDKEKEENDKNQLE